MFLKKRPSNLPKSPDLEKVKDFSLFGGPRTPVGQGAAPAEGSPRYRPRVPESDIIDVEVVERLDVGQPANQGTAQPDAEHSGAEPEVATSAPANAGRAEQAAPPQHAAEEAKPQPAASKPGLKILRKAAAPSQEAPAEPAANRPLPAEIAKKPVHPSKSASASSGASSGWAERLKGGLGKKGGPAADLGVEPAPSKTSRFFGRQEPASPAGGPPEGAVPSPETTQPALGRAKSWLKGFAREKAVGETTQKAPAAAASAATASEPADKANPLSRFARKPAPEQAKPAESKSRFGLGYFGRGAAAKAEGNNDDKPAKPRSAKVKPVNTSRTGAPRGALDVLIELEGNRRVFWRVTATGFEELPAERVRKAASFSRNEQRFHVESSVSFNQAQDLALAEVGEDVRIVNGSRSVKAVYSATAQRIADLQPVSIGPGLLLIDELLLKERTPGEELICGLILKGASDSQSLAVLYHFTDQDEVAATQITVNPDNLNFVLAQFASSRRLEVADTKVILFNNEDLLKAAGKVQYFPAEAVWRGVPVRVVLWTATAVAAGAAGLCGLYAAQAYVRVAAAQAKVTAVSAEQKKVQKSIDELLTSSVVSFAHSQSLDLGQMTERAGEFWTPGAKVVVDATARVETYNITLPLTRGGLMGNRPSVLHQLNLGHVEPLLKKEPPEGCAKAMPEVSGGLNAVQVTITCESTTGTLSGYRLD